MEGTEDYSSNRPHLSLKGDFKNFLANISTKYKTKNPEINSIEEQLTFIYEVRKLQNTCSNKYIDKI